MAIALEIYEALRAEKFDAVLENRLNRETDRLATKADVKDMATKSDLANLRAELMRWMFIFWIGQFASIVGVLTAILFAFFKP